MVAKGESRGRFAPRVELIDTPKPGGALFLTIYCLSNGKKQ